MHLILHTILRPFNCPQSYCNKTFKRKADLLIHQSIHSNKPLKFEECKQLFSDENSLISHKCSHSMEKLFKCDFDGCDKKFKLNELLKEHKNEFIAVLNAINVFLNKCNKCFITWTELRLHIGYKHSTDRPFKCNFQQCQSSFKSMSNLRRHKFSHLKISKLY